MLPRKVLHLCSDVCVMVHWCLLLAHQARLLSEVAKTTNADVRSQGKTTNADVRNQGKISNADVCNQGKISNADVRIESRKDL